MDKKLLKKVSTNAQKTLGMSWQTIANITYKEYLQVIEDYKKEQKDERIKS